MGACSFYQSAYGKDLQDAYKNAVDEARYEHGHDSYNGTISTTDLIGLDSSAPRYGTKAFSKYLNKRLDTMDKWSCLAVEVTGKALKEYRQRHGLQRRKIKVYFFYGIAGC